jgi:chromosomal replication initiation ATPase DnaA
MNQEKINEMIDTACSVFDISRENLIGRSHKPEYVGPRHITWAAMYDSKVRMTSIAKAFQRSHSTVIPMLKKIDFQRTRYKYIESKVNNLSEIYIKNICYIEK